MSESLLGALRGRLARLRFRTALKRLFPGLTIDDSAGVRGPWENLRCGEDVHVDHGVLLHCGGMAWSEGRGFIHIGSRCYIGPNAVLFGAGEIEIGSDVLISPGVVLTSHQHGHGAVDVPMGAQPASFGRITVEDDVWIGSNATVLPGVRLGRGSIIGAGAVVTRDVPPFSVVLGVPARVVRVRGVEEATDPVSPGTE